MKLLLFFISFLLVSNNLLIAQKTINQADFEKLVDYANTQYVMAFIEENDAHKPYYRDTYLRTVKPELSKANLSDFSTIPGIKRLRELLESNQPARLLADRINDRKERFGEYHDNASLIRSLSTTGWHNVDLSQTAQRIINEILAKYTTSNNNARVSEGDIVRSQTIQTIRQVEAMEDSLALLGSRIAGLPESPSVNQKSLNFLRIMVFVLAGLIALMVVGGIWFIRQLTSRDRLIEVILDSQRIAEKFKQQDFRKTIERDFKHFIEEIVREQLKNNASAAIESPFLKQGVAPVVEPPSLYLSGQRGNCFTKAEPFKEGSYFMMVNCQYDTAEFTFVGDSKKAIAQRIFDDRISRINRGGYQFEHSTVKVIKNGKLRRNESGWEVVEPIQIEFI